MAISPIGFSPARNMLRVSSAEPAKKTGKFRNTNRRRVRDVTKVEKQHKKQPRLFRIRSVQMTARNQRHVAKHIQSQMLRSLSDWHGFIDSLPELEDLDDAYLFVLDSIHQSSYLYPKDIHKKLNDYLEKVALHVNSSRSLEVNASIVQLLITKDNVISNLMTLLNLCRQYEQRKLKLKNSNNDGTDGTEK